MPRSVDSGHFDFAEHLRRLQLDLSARLHVAQQIEHPSASGTAAENHWIAFLNAHLPDRYRACAAFVLHPSGKRSRQIDIAIYDAHLAAPFFANYIPIESIRAVFEVKPTVSRQWLTDAAQKARSVQSLAPTRKILCGLLAKSSVWSPETFPKNLPKSLPSNLQLGCSLEHGSFTRTKVSPADRSLHFFLAHLLTHLTPTLKPYFALKSKPK